MQSLNWYIRRLRSMSSQEILWRVQAKARQTTDALYLNKRQGELPPERVAHVNGTVLKVDTHAPGLAAVTDYQDTTFAPEVSAWIAALIEKAERIRNHRLDLFDMKDVDLGETLEWNREHKAGISTPLTFAPSIDYRDYSVTGDCKFAWEPSRCQHLVVLARAYRSTGDERFAEAVIEQITSWLDQCPYGMGMQWRSPLELGIRVINWAWALALIEPSGVLREPLRSRVLTSVYRHLWDIQRNYSRYSSANNHLIGEAAGVYIGCSVFSNLRMADAWRQESREILIREIEAQTYADGGTREQAIEYHLFIIEFFMLSGLISRQCGESFPESYWNRLEKMFDFVRKMAGGGEHLPMLGDADDGYVLNLGGMEHRARALLATGAVLYEKSDYALASMAQIEPVWWLLGREGVERYEALSASEKKGALCSEECPDTGYYLLQCGRGREDGCMSVGFDCGELGFGPIAAHGHADALSITLRVGGADVLVDPGTYDYFTYGPWREYFRSTRAHNTVVVDSQNQSEMLGPFLWGERAQSTCLQWEPDADGGRVVGEHNGYGSLPSPVQHKRTVTLVGSDGEVRVQDELTGNASHSAELYWHFAEDCDVVQKDERTFVVSVGTKQVCLEMDEQLTVERFHGSEDPIAGWVSRGYHRKSPATTLVGRVTWNQGLQLQTKITVL